MLLVMVFAWVASRSEGRDLTIAVTGDKKLVETFVANVASNLDDVATLDTVADRATALDSIDRREAIGAVVLEEGAPEVLVASAAGDAPATIMRTLGARLQSELDRQVFGAVKQGITGAAQAMQAAQAAQGGQPAQAAQAAPAAPDLGAVLSRLPQQLPEVTVTEVATHPEHDPNGAGAVVAGIPLTVGAILTGVLIALGVVGRWQRSSAVLGLGVGGGLLLALTLGPWLGIFTANFGLVWLACSLSLIATAGLIVGLHSVLGRAGIATAGALTLFVAMPLAAFAIPPQFLPGGLGGLGQALIPGATSTVLRTTTDFPAASAAGAWWALSLWAAFGLLLALSKRYGSGSPARNPRRPGDLQRIGF